MRCSDEKITVQHSDDAFAPVVYLILKRLHLEEKSGHSLDTLSSVRHLMKLSDNLPEELLSGFQLPIVGGMHFKFDYIRIKLK